MPSCLAVGFLLFAASGVLAQTSSKSTRPATQSRSRAEQDARVRWQPSRPDSRDESSSGSVANNLGKSKSNVRQVGHQTSRSGVRRTQATGELPAPTPVPLPMSSMSGDGYEVPMQSDRSVMMNSPSQAYQPMEGEVIYEGSPYTGDVVMDQYGDHMGMGMGGSSCDGGSCGVGGCDSMG